MGKDAVRRGIRTSGGTPLEVLILQWNLVGGPGCDQTYDDREVGTRPFSGRTSPGLEYQGVPERL